MASRREDIQIVACVGGVVVSAVIAFVPACGGDDVTSTGSSPAMSGAPSLAGGQPSSGGAAAGGESAAAGQLGSGGRPASDGGGSLGGERASGGGHSIGGDAVSGGSDGGAADGGAESMTAGSGGEAAVPDETGPDPFGSQAVAYQIDPGHTGFQPHDSLRLPLQPRWAHTFASEMSYPVVAWGRVFVTVRNASSYGTSISALDAETGNLLWGPVALGGTYSWSNATYADGRVFTVNYGGEMSAFNAATGKRLWSVPLPGQYAFSSPPTAAAGRVFVAGAGGGGTLYAVSPQTGEVLWSAPVLNGDNSSPAVSGSGVFASFACNHAYGFELSSGAELWHHVPNCSGGGGKTVMLNDGRVHTRDFDGNLILSATSGELLGSFKADFIPAAAADALYTVASGVLTAKTLGEASPRWTLSDAGVISAPLVMGNLVIAATYDAELLALAVDDGAAVSTFQLPGAPASPDEHNVSQPLTGFAAAEGKLFIPCGQQLLAF